MDKIEMAEPDPLWVGHFQEERDRLWQALAGLEVLAVEHFGSTAIPRMPAKPIIDILIAVPRVREAAVSFVPRLEALGYAYWSGNPNHDRLFFVKGLPPTARRRTHHVHVAEPASEMWERLLFRDYLRAMPREAERYADLKRRLADRFASDREASTRGKHEFVRQMMDAARSWSEQALRSQEQGGCRPASS